MTLGAKTQDACIGHHRCAPVGWLSLATMGRVFGGPRKREEFGGKQPADPRRGASASSKLAMV